MFEAQKINWNEITLKASTKDLAKDSALSDFGCAYDPLNLDPGTLLKTA
jgi:hypothetical protein